MVEQMAARAARVEEVRCSREARLRARIDVLLHRLAVKERRILELEQALRSRQ